MQPIEVTLTMQMCEMKGNKVYRSAPEKFETPWFGCEWKTWKNGGSSPTGFIPGKHAKTNWS